jgi:hypothetical protein
VKILLDAMYSPAIAEGLRALGHDAVSANDRAELLSASDDAILATAQDERRALLTNNVRDFVPLAQAALRTDSTFHGLILTSDKSLPRSRDTIGTFVRLLAALLIEHPGEDGMSGQIHWLTPND